MIWNARAVVEAALTRHPHIPLAGEPERRLSRPLDDELCAYTGYRLWSFDLSSTFLMMVSRTSLCLIYRRARISRSPSSGFGQKGLSGRSCSGSGDLALRRIT